MLKCIKAYLNRNWVYYSYDNDFENVEYNIRIHKITGAIQVLDIDGWCYFKYLEDGERVRSLLKQSNPE